VAGLSLNGRASAAVGVAASPAPATATEAAFGPANRQPTTLAALKPNDPGGMAFWWSVGSVAVLLFLYFTLPE
jgi:hypothetical protein